MTTSILCACRELPFSVLRCQQNDKKGEEISDIYSTIIYRQRTKKNEGSEQYKPITIASITSGPALLLWIVWYKFFSSYSSRGKSFEENTGWRGLFVSWFIKCTAFHSDTDSVKSGVYSRTFVHFVQTVWFRCSCKKKKLLKALTFIQWTNVLGTLPYRCVKIFITGMYTCKQTRTFSDVLMFFWPCIIV